MTTFKRICIKDYTVSYSIGQELTLTRGKEYLTSNERDGEVCVFSTFWVYVPVGLFAGAERFT